MRTYVVIYTLENGQAAMCEISFNPDANLYRLPRSAFESAFEVLLKRNGKDVVNGSVRIMAENMTMEDYIIMKAKE